eukprot:1907795-Rhodomonas_salina.2
MSYALLLVFGTVLDFTAIVCGYAGTICGPDLGYAGTIRDTERGYADTIRGTERGFAGTR